jgi:hypothetical protein
MPLSKRKTKIPAISANSIAVAPLWSRPIRRHGACTEALRQLRSNRGNGWKLDEPSKRMVSTLANKPTALFRRQVQDTGAFVAVGEEPTTVDPETADHHR